MRKTKLAAAVSLALAGSAGVLDSAQAVHVDPDNLGEALLYPYYTVRSGYDTLIAIVNTQDRVKAVKVRFLEGKNSQEVLDFNLYLSPNDIWTGAVVRTAEGAKLTTTDSSCTVPLIPEDGVEFRNFEYTGEDADGEDPTLDRTREGYIEVIEMGVIQPGTTLAAAATHAGGLDCSALVDAWRSGGVWGDGTPSTNIIYDRTEPGELVGQAILIDVEQGTSYGYTATALDDFLPGVLHTAPGETQPSLAATRPVSHIFTGQGVQQSFWPFKAVNAVSAVLMHNNVINTFVTDTSISAGTDWVVNFPTKRFYVEVDDPADPDDTETVGAIPPFTEDFWAGGACERVALHIWNREEETTVGGVDFSPQPPGAANELCWEVNVITFNDTSVLGSQLELNVDTSNVGPNGWMKLSFPAGDDEHRLVSADPPPAASDPNPDIYIGLPVIGFAVQEYVNGDLNGVLSNYGGLFEHAATRIVSDVGVP